MNPISPNSSPNDSSGESFPEAEESLSRLHRAGWSVACTAFKGPQTQVWMISGYNGENQILTVSANRDEAWWHACIQARSVGMLGRMKA